MRLIEYLCSGSLKRFCFLVKKTALKSVPIMLGYAQRKVIAYHFSLTQ
jgi:hypothetical protein